MMDGPLSSSRYVLHQDTLVQRPIVLLEAYQGRETSEGTRRPQYGEATGGNCWTRHHSTPTVRAMLTPATVVRPCVILSGGFLCLRASLGVARGQCGVSGVQ